MACYTEGPLGVDQVLDPIRLATPASLVGKQRERARVRSLRQMGIAPEDIYRSYRQGADMLREQRRLTRPFQRQELIERHRAGLWQKPKSAYQFRREY